jgi:Domain of unknown function (DUF4396)
MAQAHAHSVDSPTPAAIRATLHCLTGCAIGEILGMVLATALDLGNAPSVILSVALAFLFGYALTLGSVIAAGVPPRRAARLTVASDTVSIATMELVNTPSSCWFQERLPPASPTGCSGGASS